MAVIALAMLACGALPAVGQAQTYAPVDQPGPPLSVSPSKLRASLHCEAGVRNATVEPVLLNPATGSTPTFNYGWNWEPALDMLGIPWCAYTAPHSTLDNIESSGEYLVYAIRTMHAMAHRQIAVLGHSQGGMSMRWALRFWPDTRPMVDDVIGMDGTNHGTTQQPPGCASVGCPPADIQQGANSAFIRALNSRTETFAGISYTEIYTRLDEVATPNSDAAHCTSCLHTGHGTITNVATQQVCPGDLSEHNTAGTIDAVTYAIGVDALKHPGPADPARVPKSVCSQLLMPGVTSPQAAAAGLQALEGLPGLLSVAITPLAPIVTGVKNVKAEPPLECYVFAACTGASAPTLKLSATRRRHRIRALVRTLEGSQLVPVPGATVTLHGHRARTGARGIATLPAHHGRLIARRAGCNPASRTV
jgi:triacylglycerol esterase/lipase EstA (alpha/beta hydrolase family)